MPAAASAAPTIQCFKVGRHVAMSGAALAFAASDLAATAGAYDPALHEAPIVIGHPALDAPAYGYVGGLSFAAGALEAAPRKIDPAFAEAVKNGSYGKVSAAFFPPDSPANPVPGVYYLRHVGFLGAMPPAVKGLRDPADAVAAAAASYAEFAAAHPDVIVFSEWDDIENASLWRRLREWLIGKFGLEAADAAVPGYSVASLENSAQLELREAAATEVPPTPAAPAFAQPAAEPAQEKSTVTEAEALALKAENDALKAKLDAASAAARNTRLAAAHAEHTAFAEDLQARAIWPQAGVALVVETLDHLARQDAPVEFGEGAEKKPLAQALRELLASLPPRVEFGQAASAARAAGTGLDTSDASAIALAARDHQDKERQSGRDVDIAHAVAHVMRASAAR
jgi:hypothetical protein